MTDPYGIIDLSTLRKPEGGAQGEAASPHEVAVTEATLQQIVQDSTRVATLMVVTSARAPQLVTYVDALRRRVDARGGALRLAVVDADAEPSVAAALRIQQVPALLVLLAGQLQPVAQGVVADQDLDRLIEQVLEVAQQQGLDTRGAADTEQQPEEEPLPPLLRTAYDAIEADDIDGAIAAFDQHLLEHPADPQAVSGRAVARLMARTRSADLQAARAAAAQAPQDLQAQMLVADLDMLGGHVDDALGRLLELLRGADAETKEIVRTRLLELFDVVGGDDPRVGAARRRMANLLF